MTKKQFVAVNYSGKRFIIWAPGVSLKKCFFFVIIDSGKNKLRLHQ